MSAQLAQQLQKPLPLSEAELKGIAVFHTKNDDAVSLHLGNEHPNDPSHHREELFVRALLKEVSERLHNTDAVASLHGYVQDWLANCRNGRSIFLCPSMDFVRVIDASPSCTGVSVGHSFTVVPLLTALQDLEPYAAVIAERGRARAFVLSDGVQREIPAPNASAELQEHPQDSRVGWSSHIETHRNDHLKHYWHALSEFLDQICAAHHIKHVLIGMRDDVRGEFTPYLALRDQEIELTTFLPPKFEADASEIESFLKEVRLQARSHTALRAIQMIRDENHAQGWTTVGPSAVHDLNMGRARALFISQDLQQIAFQCRQCGQLDMQRPNECDACRSTDINAIDLAEGLARKAFLSNALIHIVPAMGVAGFGGVAVLRRYI